MDEELREQPAMEPANVSIETNEERAASEAGSLNDISSRQVEKPEEGELGKFKSASALFDAYTNLQAEFTKKCQRLSQLEKDKVDKDFSDKENLDEKFNQFLSKNGDAMQFSDEIKSLVESDVSLHKVDNPFELAWAKVVLNHVASKKASDPIINRYVLSNDEITKRIVENYLDALKGQNSPIIISSQKGERVSSTKPDTPTSLTEAKSMVEKLFS